MRIKDLCEQANQAPLSPLPRSLSLIRDWVNCFWDFRFPGVKRVLPFMSRWDPGFQERDRMLRGIPETGE